MDARYKVKGFLLTISICVMSSHSGGIVRKSEGGEKEHVFWLRLLVSLFLAEKGERRSGGVRDLGTPSAIEFAWASADFQLLHKRPF